VSSISRPLVVPKPSAPVPAPAPVAGPSTLVPILSKSSKTSPHPMAERQKGLRTLYTQYEKLVSTLAASSSITLALLNLLLFMPPFLPMNRCNLSQLTT
jgi:hypothetical protein